MNNLLSRYIHKHRAIAILAGMLLLTTSLASLGAGPDEPKASTVNRRLGDLSKATPTPTTGRRRRALLWWPVWAVARKAIRPPQ